MGTEQTAAAAPAADDAGLTLAGLIDLLDRADDGVGPRRPRPRRAALHRTPAARRGTRRTTPSRPLPLRSLRPAPPARLPAAAAAAPGPERPEAGAEPRLGLRVRLRALIRRVALWGAGPGGAHLAWGAPPPPPAYRPTATDRGPVDPPVVLRELPSTPTNRPAASSPAAAARPTAARVERWVRPGTVGRPPAPLPAARGPVARRARSPGGIRGSPGTAPARGSPPEEPEPG